MLVLSRKRQESIVFPTLGISIQVLRLANGIVRLGIEAPEHIKILRGELVDADATTDQVNEHSGS